MEPAAYAEHRGVTRQAVHKAIAEGRIPLVRGRIDRDDADRRWAEATTPPPESPEAGEGAREVTFNRARTLTQITRARILQLQFEEMSGRKLDAAKVRDLVYAQGKAVQDELISQPARLAPALAAAKTRAEIEKVLSIDNREILERLARAAGAAAAALEPAANGKGA
jgi:hypothetical protein